eukprot:9109810-Pyramimonas_sp.AAC.1
MAGAGWHILNRCPPLLDLRDHAVSMQECVAAGSSRLPAAFHVKPDSLHPVEVLMARTVADN